MKIATFSSVWGTSTGGVDVFNKHLVKAIASGKEGVQVCACLQINSNGLEQDSKELGFIYATPEEAKAKNLSSERIGEWTEVQATAVTYKMLIQRKFKPDCVFLHDIFCKEVLTVVKRLIPQVKIVTFFHCAYGRSEKRKGKSDIELDRKANFQAEMIQESDLSLSVGSFCVDYLKSLISGSGEKIMIDYIVPGRPDITSSAQKATHFHAMSFGRLDPVSDSIKQIRISAKAWNEARKSKSITKLETTDSCFYAVGHCGKTEGVLENEKKSLFNTYLADILELPFEDVANFENSKLKRHLEKCSFVLLNSWYENFGLTYLETCAFGIPAIISESSGFFHELRRIIGEEDTNSLLITIPTDGVSEEELIDKIKIKLISNAQMYDDVFNNAKKLKDFIRKKWPTWKEVATQTIEKLRELGVSDSVGLDQVESSEPSAISENDLAPPWDEKIEDLSKWCWQYNVEYHKRMISESNIRTMFKHPLTSLQKSLWDRRQEILYHNFRDIVLSGGTSSGKTTLAELLFGLSRPNEFARARILYIAPTKALAQERAKAWANIFPSPNLKNPDYTPVIVSTGDDNASDGALLRGDFNIASTVYEKANVILSASQDLFGKLNMVIIDEFHMIEDLHRGSILECLLAKIRIEKERRRESVDRDNHLRLVVITTEKLGKSLENYLTFVDYELSENIEPLILSDPSRARPIDHHCVVPGKTNSLKPAIFKIKTFNPEEPLQIKAEETKQICRDFLLFRSTLNQIPDNVGYDAKRIRREYYKEFIDEWMIENIKGKRLLVFMSSKFEVLEVARFIKNHISKKFKYDLTCGDHAEIAPNENGIQTAINAISEVEQTDFNQDLMRCAEEGVFIHNADVTQKVRKTFEEYLGFELPNESRSEIIFATETLSFGVNLKVTDIALFNVLFPESERIQTGKPKSILLSRCDFANMAGRAGRLGQSESGRNSCVYWYLDPEEEKSFESVLQSFYVSSPEIRSQLFYKSDARILANFAKLERQSSLLIESVNTDTKCNTETDFRSNSNAVEEFSYPFTRSVLDGLRFLGGTENAVGFLGQIGCTAEQVIANFFFETLYYKENCEPLTSTQKPLESDRRLLKEKEIMKAVRKIISSASDPVYNLIRKPATGGYLITPLGCSTIDTGTEIATVTKLRHSLLTLTDFWTASCAGHLPFEIAIIPVFFQPEVHRKYLAHLPEFRHAMEWSAAENRADLISRATIFLCNMKVINSENTTATHNVLQLYMEWAVRNQPVLREQGRYEEAPQDSCLRLYVAFLAWISGSSLRDVIGEIQKIYPNSGQSTGSSVFNFESFTENLTWKIVFLISLIRASKEQILPASSTFNAVRFIHRSRFGCTEKAIPLLFKNKYTSPPLNRVKVHALLKEGFSNADIAIGNLDSQESLTQTAKRQLSRHVRNFIKDSFQELSRQFSYLASGEGLQKVNEDISKLYWAFALNQIISLVSNAKPTEGQWSPSSIEEKGELSNLIEQEETDGQIFISKSLQGIEIELYSPEFESDDSDQISVRKTSHFHSHFSFGDHLDDIDKDYEGVSSNLIVVDFPWSAGAAAGSDEYSRLSPAAFGILLSLCARQFTIDAEQLIYTVISGAKGKAIGARELYMLSEPYLKRGSFPESLFEAWAKYIEVGEF